LLLGISIWGIASACSARPHPGGSALGVPVLGADVVFGHHATSILLVFMAALSLMLAAPSAKHGRRQRADDGLKLPVWPFHVLRCRHSGRHDPHRCAPGPLCSRGDDPAMIDRDPLPCSASH